MRAFKGMTMINAKAATPPTVHTITFDISTDPDQGVAIVIDDVLHVVGSQTPKHTGFSPNELFSAELPLIPTYPPRRVAVAQCSCGVAGCGNITPLIAYGGPDQDQVIWSDFRDLGSAVSSPLDIDFDGRSDAGSPLLQDDLVFDRVQYEAAVLAASADRTWESAGEATARLLRGLLSTDAAVLRTLGFHLTWLTPSHRIPRAWTLSLLVPHPRRTASQRRADAIFDAAERPRSTGQGRGIHTSMWTSRLRRRPWEHEPRQVILELTTDAASPISQAAELYRQLTEVPLADWERTFPRSEHP